MKDEMKTNPSCDLISRADAIEAVTDIQDGSGQRYYLAVSLVDKIRSLPSADAVSREEYERLEALYGAIRIYDSSGDVVQGDGRNNIKRYPNCQMRTSLGNCDAIGGFCTSINAPICDAFHKLSEAVQGWIPCSERLPKRDELVLVTYKTTDRIHLCRYLDDGSENPWWSYIDDCCAWNNVVLAWMPLPKPYKGGDTE